MASGKGTTETFNVTTLPEDKGSARSSRKRILIFAALAVIILFIIVAVCLGVILSQNDNKAGRSRGPKYPVILISADGFRPDYLTLGLTPHITEFGNSGVRAKFMLSQFPTKTFPNHYTAVTGLYPESHGIVFNSFYDPDLRRRFSIRNSKYPPFWGGEPIWVTARKNGIKSASYFWVGSEIKGMLPTYYKKYKQSVPFSDRVKKVLQWLKLPEDERPSIIMLYFHEPDYAGHGYGPDSPAVRKQIKLVDKTIGQLLTGLEDMKLNDSVNIILLSDHGMSAVDCSKNIYLDKYGLLANKLYITNDGSVATFKPKKRSDLESTFDKIKCRNNSFQSFYKADLPKRMHFSKSRRIDDIIVFADPGQVVTVNSTGYRCWNGTHGYDNIQPDMWPIFMASGPSFEKGKVVEHFSNLEIYNLLATLLNIKPAPNNGTMGSLNHFLVPEARYNVSKPQGDGTEFRTDICKFPNETIFDFRSKNVCPSCKVTPNVANNISEMNMIFNITTQQASLYEEEHLPWGLPEGGVREQGCLLSQPYFIAGYSTHLRIPLWTANTINGTQLSQSNKTEECYRNDVRLTKTQSAHCTSYNPGYDQGQLVPSRDLNFNRMAMFSASTFSNIVPMYSVFRKGIWARLESMIRDWARTYDVVHVISGTIFDVDNDGIKDKKISTKRRTHNMYENPAVPTHFYKIVTRCDSNTTSEQETDECSGTIRVISFILRHTNEHCQLYSYEKLILQNVAPVKDIELLTGINFFSKLPAQLQVQLSTFVPVKLWA